MSLDLKAIREAIAARIQESCNVTAYPYDKATVVYPRAIVLPGSPAVEYHAAMRDLCRLNFRIEVRCSAGDSVAAQIALDQFVNAGTGQSKSVFDALEDLTVGTTSPNLAGVVENINVESVELPDGIQFPGPNGEPNGGPFEFTAIFRVAVKARRD